MAFGVPNEFHEQKMLVVMPVGMWGGMLMGTAGGGDAGKGCQQGMLTENVNVECRQGTPTGGADKERRQGMPTGGDDRQRDTYRRQISY